MNYQFFYSPSYQLIVSIVGYYSSKEYYNAFAVRIDTDSLHFCRHSTSLKVSTGDGTLLIYPIIPFFTERTINLWLEKSPLWDVLVTGAKKIGEMSSETIFPIISFDTGLLYMITTNNNNQYHSKYESNIFSREIVLIDMMHYQIQMAVL